VKSKADATTVLKEIGDGTSSFADLARQYSTCPSGKQGGSLGSFAPGTMVPEFDQVIFSPDTVIGQVYGPVETKVRTVLM
jgi:peptidyl-prolyl cis-trans isomerase C